VRLHHTEFVPATPDSKLQWETVRLIDVGNMSVVHVVLYCLHESEMFIFKRCLKSVCFREFLFVLNLIMF
jgi:hypothetical protein